ncbi:hypothetical protein [Gorillibacterium sp. sgz5001074]|uniref:hypothetical protein n=1 Tax=Gorillibacterium sp. sgz5001074 TaxID=3446695 RepID=UPI003F676AAA
MDFYSMWIYRYVLNAPWFVWGFVWTIFALNLLMPLLLWLTIAGRRIRMPGSSKKPGTQNETHPDPG